MIRRLFFARRLTRYGLFIVLLTIFNICFYIAMLFSGDGDSISSRLKARGKLCIFSIQHISSNINETETIFIDSILFRKVQFVVNGQQIVALNLRLWPLVSDSATTFSVGVQISRNDHFWPALCLSLQWFVVVYSRFQIFRHDIAKKYKIKRLMRRIRPRKFSVRLVSTELIPTRFIFTKEAYRATPFSLQGTTFVLFNYIVPKYLKPTIFLFIWR